VLYVACSTKCTASGRISESNSYRKLLDCHASGYLVERLLVEDAMSDICLVRREPNKGYYGRWLWLPKRLINVKAVKRGLEFPTVTADGLEYLQLWKENETHLITPREYISRKNYYKLPFPIINVGPRTFRKVDFKSRIILDLKEPTRATQTSAFRAMLASGGGLLNLACGKGKTVIALQHIATRKVPALVVVNNTTLIKQWKERIDEFLEVPGGVGFAQGPPSEWDWEGRGIVIGMIHSLALRYDQLPDGFSRYFGGVYYDEVHHLSAPLFIRTAPLFYGERHGLTATISREDGLEAIYLYHIGDAYFKDLSQDLRPKIYFQICPIRLHTQDRAVREAITDGKGRLNIPKLRTYLGTLEECNNFIADRLKPPLEVGRKILVLSHSVEQLRRLHSMFSESGLCIGSEKPEARMETLKTKRIIFGTMQLVREALDEASLDTLYILTPFGRADIERGGVNTLQQAMGRILRHRPGKQEPVVVIFDYIFIPKLHRMCSTLKWRLETWPDDQGGPMEYSVLQP